MSYDLAGAVGYESPDAPAAWTTRDLLLYAVGIGATEKPSDFPITYELSKNFAAFPTFPVVLPFKEASPEVVDFNKSFGGPGTPGLPSFDPSRVVHGSQFVEILKPLPKQSGEGWKLKKKVVGIHENKSGIIVDQQTTLVDPKGVPYVRMISSSFNIGAKATGTKFSKAIAAGIQPSKAVPKDKAPDYVVSEGVSTTQAIIYRLSGDYNPLHVDPAIGVRAGFGGVILHGLASYGFAARAILNSLAGGSPTALKAINARFTSPVRPGDGLETSIWKIGAGPDGTVEVAFVCKNTTTGKLCLGGGVAYVYTETKSKL